MKKVFCYFSLETGTLFAGWAGMITYLLLSAYEIVWEMKMYERLKDYDGYIEHFVTRLIKCVIVEVIVITSCAMLIYAVSKRNRYYLIPWLIVCGVFGPALCLIYIMGIFVMYHRNFDILVELVRFAFITENGIFIYLWFGVHSLYQKFAQEDKDANEKNLQRGLKSGETSYVNME